MEKSDKSLILVSNRLPFQLLEQDDQLTMKQSDGGLVTALISYFNAESNRDVFQQKKWFGSADFPEKRWKKFKKQSDVQTDFTIEPVFIDKKVYNKYYNGFCNATLWPLFHYFPSYVVYDQEFFENYEEVNKIFAERLLKVIKPGDTIWIHDYQLFLLPQLIRDKMPDATIGFFLHIPFPSYEIFRLLHSPWKEKIVRGLLGADLIGFHTHEYVQHFLKTVRMVLGYDHHYRTITMQDRLVKADMFPLGIDYEKFSTASRKPEVVQKMEAITKNFPDKKIIFSVDRLDYTKGVTHRLLGFERLLEKHPEWIEKVVFVMVIVPSRQIISKYNERRILIEENVGRLNGKYSTLSWQPVIYRYNNLDFEELCALYHVADAALITPLRDGMNLVAKEYIACCSEQQGVLILSELAGAASELGEALLVNPLDTEEMSEAIQQALTMQPEEQRRKISQMQKRLIDYDVHSWVNDFLFQLTEIKQQQKTEQQKYVTPSIRKEIIHSFQEAQTRNLLLDYDGTLVAFARHPREAVPDRNLLQLLAQLGNDPKTNLTIISGRDSVVLEDWFKDIPATLVAEHGAAIRKTDHTWSQKEIDQSWKSVIRPTLEMFAKRCPGSFIEEKNHTLAWHYRNVDPDFGFMRSRELLDTLFHLVRNGQLQVMDGNKVIEVRQTGVDKGVAARNLVEETNPDFVLAIGDDKTDEDMFRILADRAITIKVGPGHSAAQYSIASQRDVIRLLNELIS
ncbi:bifunctional alpha,alpha-trehalose-phosphate synthase (UDP-forming)/trehalose-phosphatase [Ohtaekwangia koreensis]|uniref:Glucosylglycerol-phosphate synthase n=1 Tax=Ohtaekwangia koreensis TaxID=688867 RepID=A0A1T5IW53_9BACT|nr:bifunctional alpha,alpha-trehalose-phosphate synthase (UDP-forming)/trehalose-phosphatase [Ohtaekwangia koreensis]SKC43426.1 trehalose 6-phosphate synthase/phosphatase [Ohtaekwangia koreensis]